MKTSHLLFAVAGSMLLQSCASDITPVTQVTSTAAPLMEMSVKMFSPEETPPRAQAIGSVKASSCKKMLRDPQPSEAAARAQLRLDARAMGANAIGNLTCAPDSTAIAQDCWLAIVCTGTALKF